MFTVPPLFLLFLFLFSISTPHPFSRSKAEAVSHRVLEWILRKLADTSDTSAHLIHCVLTLAVSGATSNPHKFLQIVRLGERNHWRKAAGIIEQLLAKVHKKSYRFHNHDQDPTPNGSFSYTVWTKKVSDVAQNFVQSKKDKQTDRLEKEFDPVSPWIKRTSCLQEMDWTLRILVCTKRATWHLEQ